MPVITASIDPITRIEGHLKVDVEIDTVDGVQQVVDAHTVGTLFRGFEKIMEGRDPRPPSGWDDDSQPGGPSADAGEDKSKDAPIGGPAGQH